MTTSDQTPRRRYCPTRKMKYFNQAWADLAAAEQTARFGNLFRSYQCTCGWWHTYDRTKRHIKEKLREPRNTRRRRVRRGEPSPLQVLKAQQERERQYARYLKNLRKKRRANLPLCVWEDDGGAIWFPNYPEEKGT